MMKVNLILNTRLKMTQIWIFTLYNCFLQEFKTLFKKLTFPHLFVIVANFPVGGDEEDVLRLQIGVRQLAVVQEPDRVAELVRDVPDLVQRVGMIVVLLLQNQRKVQGKEGINESFQIVFHGISKQQNLVSLLIGI